MSRRHAPEDHDTGDYPLLSAIDQAEKQAARERAEVGMARAVTKAERVMEGWRGNAIEAVRLFAATHDAFVTEDVRRVFPTPHNCDGRAWGAVMRDAASRGYVKADGYAPTNSSNGSPKVRWRSLIR